jgi:hypothetical protein
LFVKVTFNANNWIFLLAYTLVDEENNVNWSWFLRLIQRHITGDRCAICIISDRYAGIKHGMTTIWPELIGYHRYCVRHLASNFNHKFKDLSAKKELLRKCYESLKHKFDEWFDDMVNSHPERKEWLEWELKKR